jgi:di/tricarboxylate transporter
MLGFMIPTTATRVMMLPILQAVLTEIQGDANLTKMMMLAICYSANVGGTGTLIGQTFLINS